jgi:hypothetical protein
VAAFDANLGSTSTSGGALTLTLTTTAAAAALTRIVVLISYWNSSGTALITGVMVGGTAATRDLRVTHTNGNDIFEIWSVPKAAGLASSSSIVATAAGNMSGVLMGAVSLSGVDMTNGGGVAGSGSSNAQSGTNWLSGTASAAGGIAVGGAGNETVTTSEVATATTGTLVHHLWNTTAQQGFATAYNLGGTSVAGTFASTSTATTGGIVAYTDSVAPVAMSVPIRDFPARTFGPF